VAGLVLAAVGGAELRHDRADSEVDGSHGAFPAPVAAALPLHSVHPVGAIPNGSLVYHGLDIEARHGSGAVSAANIRTRQAYWLYRRPGYRVDGARVDATTGRLFVMWATLNRYGDAAPPLSVAMIDVRSGHVRWTRTMPRDITIGDDVILVGTDTVAAIGNNGMTGFDARNGRQRWTKRWPRCETDGLFRWGHPVAVAGTFVVKQQCYDSPAGMAGRTAPHLAGYDSASGVGRWDLRFAQWWSKKTDPDGRTANFADFDGRSLAVWSGQRWGLVDPATGRVIADHTSPASGRLFAGGTQVAVCGFSESFDAPSQVCAIDPKTGKTLWRYRLPRPLVMPSERALAIADGRAYVLASPPPKPPTWLIIIDLHTGRSLGRLHIPALNVGLFDIADVADGGS
jgi:outer membrane protein assembly factor BamB